MKKARRTRWVIALWVALLAVLTTLAGCSTATPDDASSTKGLPLVQPGELTIGSDLTYPPYAYLENGNPAGFDPELATALAGELGLRPNFKDTRFEQLINGVKANQFDIIASALYVTEERAAVVTFVPYFTTGNSLIVPKSGTFQPKQVLDLCGQRVAAIKGGDVVKQLRTVGSQQCTKAGRDKIDVREFTTDPEASSALKAGQVEAQITDGAVAKGLVDQTPSLQISSTELLYPVPVGIGINSQKPALAKAVNDALMRLKKSGAYDQLLQKYNLGQTDPALVKVALGQHAQAQAAELSGGTAQASDAIFDVGYFFSLFHNTDLWKAAGVVVVLSVLVWVISTVLGLFVALGKQSGNRVLRKVLGVYVWFFRSLPLLVLLIFVYNAPQAIPALRVLISNPFVAGLVAMVLSETAYIAEIHRGGLLSVGKDQREAGRALGLRQGSISRSIVVPQAFRISLPSLGNEFVTILKLTSLVSAISLAELLLVGQRLYTQNFKVLETLSAVAIYYVALVTVFDYLHRSLERRLDVGRRTTSLVADPESGLDAEAAVAVAAARQRREHAGEVVLKVDDLSKSFGDNTVLNGVDLTVHKGEVVAIIGPSGSGKTTLIRTMNHLETVDDGRVELDGELIGYRLGPDGKILESSDNAVAAQRQRVGMVFQRFNLFPHMSVIDNVTLAPSRLGLMNRAEAEAEARRLLDRVGMGQHRNRYPHQLSGGQQQRVAIARAMAMQPEVILFDEPTSALDPELVGEVLQVMTKMAVEGVTMVVVTHEMRFAREVADWIVFMDGGRIIDQGPPEHVFEGSAESRVQAFMAKVSG